MPMDRIDEYVNRAKDLAADAGDAAKTVAGDVISRAKDLAEEGSAAREIARSAKGRAVSVAEGAKEKVQGMMQDAAAVREIRQGIADLEALPEFGGSILYTMELETMINTLSSLCLTITDNRLDDPSVAEEIRKAMDKVRPDELQQATEEDMAINGARKIAFDSCERALESLDLPL